MKTDFKTIIIAVIILANIIFSCKKKEPKTEDPVAPTPEGTGYSTFSSTIAVIDYTAPTNAATSGYTANLSVTTTAMAYIVADGAKIDSLPLVITRTADIVPSSVTSSTASPCDANIWKTYSLNSKEFKLKTGANNELNIYEDGMKVSSRPILIKASTTLYDFSNGYSSTDPKTKGSPCPDGIKYFIIQ